MDRRIEQILQREVHLERLSTHGAQTRHALLRHALCLTSSDDHHQEFHSAKLGRVLHGESLRNHALHHRHLDLHHFSTSETPARNGLVEVAVGVVPAHRHAAVRRRLEDVVAVSRGGEHVLVRLELGALLLVGLVGGELALEVRAEADVVLEHRELEEEELAFGERDGVAVVLAAQNGGTQALRPHHGGRDDGRDGRV